MLALGVGNAWGAETVETISYSNHTGKGTSSTGSEYTMNGDKFSITDSKFYCDATKTYAHFYANSTITITPNTGVTIKNIVITASSSSYNGFQSSGTFTPSIGSVTKTDDTHITWAGSATSEFTISHNKQIRWTAIEVTYEETTSGGGENPGEGGGGEDPDSGEETSATMKAGTNGTACTVNGKDGIKVGTSSKGGDMQITVPAGATMLHVYAAAWNGVTGLSLKITPTSNVTTTSIALTANAGIANSTPFTLSGNEADYLFDIPLQNITAETTLTFASSTTKRFVVWGATYETAGSDEPGTEEPAVSVPTFSVPEGTFYSPINVELSCSTTDAEIYYTLDGTTPSSTSEKYTTAIAISETTTVKAIAIKDGLTDSEVASATYTKGEIVTSYDIDFEKNALEAYVNWDFSNIAVATTTITAKAGTYYGNTCGKASASIKTKTAIQYPGTLTFYTSKESSNTTSSNWIVQVSENGSTWTEVTSFDATTGNKGTWTERTADLSDYENVYVQISYGSSTAIRAIDEISLAQGVAPVKYTLTIENPENGTLSVTKGGVSVASGEQFKAGTSLVVTPTPASGYLFESLTVDGSEVELSEGKYTFTMPENDVTISATFKANEKPAATLTLSKNGETELLPGNHKQDDVVTLPDFESDCSKTFVGWSENQNCNTEPEYKAGDSYQLKLEGNQTLYAVYAYGEMGEASLTKMTSTDAFANGDKVVIVAYGTQLGMYQETSGTTYVKYWELVGNEPTVAELDDKTIWDVEADGENWKIGDATTGYLYNASSNNLAVSTTNASIWTITWNENGFVFKSDLDRYMACRTDLTTSNKNLYRMNGTSIGNNGVYEMDVYKYIEPSPSYSNYSTTCAAAPKAEVNPTEVTATAAETTGKLTVTYDNVNTEDVTVALYNDAACTDAFTAGWLTASLDGNKNITYTVAATTLYTERKAYIKLTAPETTGATDPAVVVIPVTQAAKDKVFASLEELVAANLTAGDEVTVTLNNDVIKDFYIYSSKRCGVVFDVQKDGKDIKIYFNNQTTIDDWAVGGKLSGTLTNVKWTTYSSAWQLAPANTWAWANLTYTEPKAVSTVVVSGAPTKTTYVDGEAFDPAGLTVTVNYNDATTEVNPTGVTFTVTPTTLVKGQTSVSVTATFNSVTSAAYEVTNLTVNDIPTKTVAEFIAAGGTRCYLEGIVSGLTEGNSMKYGNFDLTDASGTIYVYGCLNAAGESQKFAALGVKNGDKIKVIADEYELYGGTKDEAKNVQYVSHVSAASITISDITMEVDEVATITATVDPVGAVVTYTIKENAANAISLSGNTITALAEGTATITATVAEGATYLGNSVDFTVTVGPKTVSDEVVILAEHNGQWYALKAEDLNSDKKVLAALAVTYFNGTLYNVNESDKISITWTRTVVGDQVTFKNGTNYLYVANPSKTELSLNATAFSWTYDAVLDTYTSNNGARTFLYSSEANGFKNFAINNNVGTKNYSGYPVVTAPVYTTGDVTYTRATTAGKFGTICLPFGSTNYTGAEFFEFVGSETGKVYIGNVDELVAGVPYIFLASAAKVVVTSDGTTAATPGNSNGLYGTFTDNTEVAVGNYILKDNALCRAEAICWVNAYRAYIKMDEVPVGIPNKVAGRRYIGMSVQGENETTGFENITAPEGQAIKVIENGQLIIIRGGEKFNVQGQKL